MSPRKGSKRDPITGKFYLPTEPQEGTNTPSESAINFNEYGEILNQTVDEVVSLKPQDDLSSVSPDETYDEPGEYAGMNDEELLQHLRDTVPPSTRVIVTRNQLFQASVAPGFCVVHHGVEDKRTTMRGGRCYPAMNYHDGRHVIFIGQDITHTSQIKQDSVVVILHLVEENVEGNELDYIQVLVFKSTGEPQELRLKGIHAGWLRQETEI